MNSLFVIVGMPGAGKSTLVEHLAGRGWPVVYFGQITLDEITRQGLTPGPQSEKDVRESIRKLHGNDAYAKLSFPRIKQALQKAPTIIDGLYSWDEYKFIRSHIANPIIVIAVCADRRIRYERLTGRPVRPLTPDEAEKRDFAEIENIQKGGPIAIADYTLLNNHTPNDLQKAADKIIDPIFKEALL